MKNLDEILNRLAEQARQSQPEFSESLQKKCEDSIRSCNPEWQVQPEKTNISTNNKYRRTSQILWTRQKFFVAAILFCAVAGLLLFANIAKIGNVEKEKTTCSAVTHIHQVTSENIAESPVYARDAIPINPEVWESIEEFRLLQDIQNAENNVNSEELRGRSASVYASVKKMIQIPSNPQEFAKAMLNQDLSMGNLMVKTSNLTKIGHKQLELQNNQDNQDNIEE